MSNDPSSQQPPHKKQIVEGSLGPISLPPDLQGSSADSFPAASGESGPSSSSGQVLNEVVSGNNNRRERGDGRAPKASAVLSQAWKEDVDAGHLLASLFELFGEAIFSFAPSVATSFFL